MPIYPYKCTNDECGHSEDSLIVPGAQQQRTPFCPMCASLMRRAYEDQNVAIRGDIEPGYDVSLGEHVGSRRELREKLAFKNAYCPDLMQNSEPLAGRLTPEERAIAEGRPVHQRKTIFERRKERGWGKEPNMGDILASNDPNAGEGTVASDGVANYDNYMKEVKERVAIAARNRQNKTG